MENQQIFFGLLSLLVGSFISVVVIRFPLGEGVVSGGSKCRSCAHKLRGLDLLPFMGWFLLRGKCRYCWQKISVLYPILEWAALGIFIWVYVQISPQFLWAGCVLGWVLLTLSAIDMRHYTLPDRLTIPLVFLGLGFNGLYFPESLIHCIAGALAGYGLFAVIRWLYLRLKSLEALGLGDAKLLSAAGAWLGWQGLPSVILLASGAGLVVGVSMYVIGKTRSQGESLARLKLPFGPFLAAALWLTWLYGPLI